MFLLLSLAICIYSAFENDDENDENVALLQESIESQFLFLSLFNTRGAKKQKPKKKAPRFSRLKETTGEREGERETFERKREERGGISLFRVFFSEGFDVLKTRTEKKSRRKKEKNLKEKLHSHTTTTQRENHIKALHERLHLPSSSHKNKTDASKKKKKRRAGVALAER